MSKKHPRPIFKTCMKMMRDRNPQTQEDGYHWLVDYAADFIPELTHELNIETDPGLCSWLMELLAETKDPCTLEIFKHRLEDPNDIIRNCAIRSLQELNTRESRTILWEAGIRTK